jgi:hypothetical protein
VVLNPFGLLSQNRIEITQGFERESTAPYLEYRLESDPSENKFDWIKTQDFSPLPNPSANLGFQKKAHWFRLKIFSSLEETKPYVLSLNYPPLDFVDIYYHDDGIWKSITTGDQSKSLARSYPFRLINLEFPIKPKAETEIYYRIFTESSLQPGSQLFAREEFLKYQLYDNLFYGLSFGSVIIISLFTIMISRFTKDSSFFYFSVFSLFGILFQANLSGHLYLLGPHELSYIQNHSLVFFNTIMTLYMTFFTMKFLNINPKENLILYRIGMLLIVYNIIMVICLISLPYSIPLRMVLINGFLYPIVFLGFSIKTYSSHKVVSQIYICTLLVVLFSTITFALKTQGLIPSKTWVDYIFPVSTSISSILLSVGISFRVDQLYKDNSRLLNNYIEEMENKKEILSSKENLIKERDLIVKELEDATQHLIQAEKLSSLGAMVAGIAHEIANPIQFIDLARWEEVEKIDELETYLFSLIPENTDSKPFRESLKKRFQELRSIQDRIKLGITRVTDIHKSMRNISRSDSLDLEEVDLRDICDEAITILGSKIKSYDFQKKYFGEHLNTSEKAEQLDTPKIKCKRSQIGQVVMNLISNSCDALEEYKKSSPEFMGKIELNLESSKHGVKIIVSDNGPGVPAHIRSKVMDAFFTTKPAGKGTGLGLAICGKIIETHNGSIQIQDGIQTQEGHGAKFVVEIPATT